LSAALKSGIDDNFPGIFKDCDPKEKRELSEEAKKKQKNILLTPMVGRFYEKMR
jgi:hypothetical protein